VSAASSADAPCVDAVHSAVWRCAWTSADTSRKPKAAFPTVPVANPTEAGGIISGGPRGSVFEDSFEHFGFTNGEMDHLSGYGAC
jgi:hypothetical protein